MKNRLDELYEDDILERGPTEEQKERRLGFLRAWSKDFSDLLAQTHPDMLERIRCDDDVIKLLNAIYWEVMYERVKRKLTGSDRDRADRHKIASLTELMISWYRPLKIADNAKEEGHWNACFAFYCALNIIGNWGKRNLVLDVSETFSEAHIALLESLDTESGAALPIFSNAATWYLVEMILKSRRDQKLP
ncbi:MAG: hypothetical protein LBU53_04610 [Zoogloeaceae bacterium]|jgi:hypothetical protein|nr:hypothetical protein [Zoogloeaceae bacterium]